MELSTQHRAMLKIQLLAAGVFLSICFLLGLALGLKRELTPALALVGGASALPPEKLSFPLVPGLSIAPFGNALELDGQPVEMISFGAERGVRELAREQYALWKDRGIRVAEQSGDQRAVLIGFDPASRRKLTFVAWESDPALRRQGLDLPRTQGTASSAPEDFLPDTRAAVPGVPLPPGATSSAVLTGLEGEGRSSTATYVIPRDVQRSISFFRERMARAGWQATLDYATDDQGMLELSKYREAVSLLFVRSDRSRTVVTVVRRFVD